MGEWSHDRCYAAINKEFYLIGFHVLYIANKTKVDAFFNRTFMAMDNVHICSGESNGIYPFGL